MSQLLIALHIWTAKEIYDVLGRFGWFYGDFFIQNEHAPLELYYTGIYRYVNNPERSKSSHLKQIKFERFNTVRSHGRCGFLRLGFSQWQQAGRGACHG